MKTKFFIVLAVLLLSAAGITSEVCRNISASMPALMKSNIEALTRDEGGLDTNYNRHPFQCSIQVAAHAKVEVFGLGILRADASGKLSFDGGLYCTSGGNATCRSIECADLYQILN